MRDQSDGLDDDDKMRGRHLGKIFKNNGCSGMSYQSEWVAGFCQISNFTQLYIQYMIMVQLNVTK